MKHTKHDLLICGTSFAGLGAAVAALEANRSVIIVERTALVGREFIDAFNPGRTWGTPATVFGQKFRDDAVARNLMDEEGHVHLPALHPVLCLLIREYGLKVKFLTEIVDVALHNGRYLVSLLDASGIHYVLVDEIWDTTTQRLTQPGNLFVPTHKRLNAYLHHPAIREAVIPTPIDDSMSIAKGRFHSEVILKVCVPPKYDWQQAKQWLHPYWEARPEEWALWTIAAVAGVFEVIVRRGPMRLEEKWIWLPSEGFDHPLEAIDSGYIHMKNSEGLADEAAL
jgi:hypothetical protein